MVVVRRHSWAGLLIMGRLHLLRRVLRGITVRYVLRALWQLRLGMLDLGRHGLKVVHSLRDWRCWRGSRAGGRKLLDIVHRVWRRARHRHGGGV